MAKQTVRDIEVKGKRVLVRVDFNVPLDAEGIILDDSRIRAVLPTVKYLLAEGAKVILCSHLGRPKGKVVAELRLAPVGQRLSELLGHQVTYVRDCIGAEVGQAAQRLKQGDVLLLENLRFHPEEEENKPEFARALAGLAEIFVNDAFGTAHRPHASTAGIANYLPAVAGFLMEKELEVLGKMLRRPAHPFAAVIGGAKVGDKVGLLEKILGKVDLLLIGGGMSCTFLRAKGYEVGRSAVELDKLSAARRVMERANRKSVPLFLPSDVVVAEGFDAFAHSLIVPIAEVPQGCYIMDIGPETIDQFTSKLQSCQTVFWNGPMGVFEFPKFSYGTSCIAKTLADLKATTIIGGGSTAEAVVEQGLEDKMTYVSTGGGASLRFIEGRTLPGVEALRDREG